MKAKDLIKILEKNPDMDIRIEYTDHTDWTYQQDLEETDVNVGEILPDEDEVNSWDFGDGDIQGLYNRQAFIFSMKY